MFLPKKSLPEVVNSLLGDRDAKDVSAEEILDTIETASMRSAPEIERLRRIYHGLNVARMLERESQK